MSEVEGSIDVGPGRKLYTKTWQTTQPAKARLVFIHGFSDHCNAYGTLFPTLASKGIEVFSYDQAGWGRSVQKPSDKGLTGTTERVLADITAFTEPLLPSPVPLFLMGHSMGGAEILTWAATAPSSIRSQVRGFLAESPFIALDPSTQPGSMIVTLGKLAAKLLPGMQRVDQLSPDKLSRDPAVCKAYADDDLCHDTGTLQGLAGMLDRADRLRSGAISIGEGIGEGGKTRLWISHGTADRVCDYNATKTLCDREKKLVQDLEFKTYDGWYHKLHAEPSPDKETFANDVSDWIFARSHPDVTELDSLLRAKL